MFNKDRKKKRNENKNEIPKPPLPPLPKEQKKIPFRKRNSFGFVLRLFFPSFFLLYNPGKKKKRKEKIAKSYRNVSRNGSFSYVRSFDEEDEEEEEEDRIKRAG